MQTAYITHPECQLHDMGRYHPESPERLRAIEDQLIASGLLGLLSEHEAPAASREQLIRVHDAEHSRAMGFCFFNNVAIGAAHALEAYGLERVAIVDFDVHHGNGTEDI